MTGCPKSDKGGGQLPHSLFFNYPINCSSSLELPSFSKEVMLRSVRKAFWEDWLGFLRFQRGNAEVSQKGFLRRLAWISESVPVDSRWIGLCQWSAQRSSKTGLSPTVQLWPRLVHALFPTKFRHLVHQLLEALLLCLHLNERSKAAAGLPSPNPPRSKTRRNPSHRGHTCGDQLHTNSPTFTCLRGGTGTTHWL